MNKKDFPLLVADPSLVYLDSTATSLKPQLVLNALDGYYRRYSANVARGIYKIAEQATKEYEESREKIARFINAPFSDEVIFTRGTTESLNLLAHTLGRQYVQEGDEVVTTVMEHHSNFVPWQQLARERGAVMKVWDVGDSGHLEGVTGSQVDLSSIVSEKTKILAITYVSNVLGTINPIKDIVESARKINPEIFVIVDAAQAAPHMALDVQLLDCDFLCFSGHKMLGPTGIGVLWGKKELLTRMQPFHYGGEMIEEVTIGRSTFKEPPHKFEAGTPHIAGAIGFGAAVDYLLAVGMDTIRMHEKKLTRHLLDSLHASFGEHITLLGPKDEEKKGGVAAFTFGTAHPHDVAQILDEESIAVRVGSHCAMPIHKRFGIIASIRASLYLYNTEEDVEKLVKGLKIVKKLLG